MTSATISLGLEETFVETPFGRVRAFSGGAGPAVVLLHGLSGGAATWIEVIDGLRAGSRVVALDLPGHGGSSRPPRDATIAWYADATAAAIAELGVVSGLVVGHSFGGQVAVRLAQRHPALVGGTVLVGPAGLTALPRRTRILAMLASIVRPGALTAPIGIRLAGREWFRRLAFGPLLVSDPAALSPRAVRGFFAEMREHTDVRTARRAILAGASAPGEGLPSPTLVLWGARDALVPLEHGFGLARQTGAHLRVVADCGHLLIGERADTVLDAIAELQRLISASSL